MTDSPQNLPPLEHHKKFSQELKAVRASIEELDKKVTSYNEAMTDKEFLSSYSKLVEQICQAFGAKRFNVFFQQEKDPLLLDGVLNIREKSGATRFQFIKNPIDNFTIEGFTFLKAKVVNVSNLYVREEEFVEMDPSRNNEIDRRLNQVTKQCLSAPIVNPNTHKILGSIVLCNSVDGKNFMELLEKGINALSIIIGISYRNGGVFARVIKTSKSIGKTSFVTSATADSQLTKEDFVEEELKSTSEASEDDLSLSLNNNKAKVSKDPNQMIDSAQDDDEEYEDENDEYEEDDEEEYEEEEEEDESGVEVSDDVANSRYLSLVVNNVISNDDLSEILSRAKREQRSAEPLLRTYKGVSLKEIGKSLANYFNLQYYPYKENCERPDDLMTIVKKSFLEEHRWIPVVDENDVTNAVSIVSPDPIHAETFGSINQMFPGRRIKMLVTTEAEYDQYFERFFADGESVESLISDIALEEEQDAPYEATGMVDSSVSDDELVRLVNKIIVDAYYRRCSDIHIEPYPGSLKTRVRFRIDGELVEYIKLSSSVRSRLVNRIKIMANMNISESRIPQDGKIKMSRYNKTLNIELRVATYPVVGSSGQNFEDVVMRILASGEPLPLEKLGMHPDQEKQLISIAEKPYGIIFVCGPTGSGKTTTLHSILHHLNTEGTKIITAEDPVEITQNGLRQMQINKQAGVTFALAIRSFLRADPDVIMVGEMRDHETVSTGVEASLTGHLVMSTLHTNSAPEAITRLLDMGMEPLNFADAMLGILAQRLAKKLCSNCCKPYHPDAEEVDLLINEYCRELEKTKNWMVDPEKAKQNVIAQLSKAYAKDGKFTFNRANGCEECLEGYKGRVGLYELLAATDKLKIAIKKNAQIEELLEIAISEGMMTLKMDGIGKVFGGKTDFKQVLLVCMK